MFSYQSVQTAQCCTHSLIKRGRIAQSLLSALCVWFGGSSLPISYHQQCSPSAVTRWRSLRVNQLFWLPQSFPYLQLPKSPTNSHRKTQREREESARSSLKNNQLKFVGRERSSTTLSSSARVRKWWERDLSCVRALSVYSLSLSLSFSTFCRCSLKWKEGRGETAYRGKRLRPSGRHLHLILQLIIVWFGVRMLKDL